MQCGHQLRHAACVRGVRTSCRSHWSSRVSLSFEFSCTINCRRTGTSLTLFEYRDRYLARELITILAKSKGRIPQQLEYWARKAEANPRGARGSSYQSVGVPGAQPGAATKVGLVVIVAFDISVQVVTTKDEVFDADQFYKSKNKKAYDWVAA